eukprot:scaffold130769_cov16-Tisochrysis_lutea.AAC.1
MQLGPRVRAVEVAKGHSSVTMAGHGCSKKEAWTLLPLFLPHALQKALSDITTMSTTKLICSPV